MCVTCSVHVLYGGEVVGGAGVVQQLRDQRGLAWGIYLDLGDRGAGDRLMNE